MTDKKIHVLVIEDNEDIVIMLRTMLEMKGYRVSTRMNLEHPVAMIHEISPDILLMDMLLSGADGREICKLIKESGDIEATIPVIMISAHPNAKIDCLHAGADYFLGKPFDMDALFNVLDKAIKQKQR